MNLSKNVKITPAILPSEGVAAQTAINGATLDMQGFEGVLVEVVFGVITGSAVTSINMAQSEASNFASGADLLGTGQTIADDADDETYYIDLYKPRERYVRVEVARATQDAVISSATYIQYGSTGLLPTSHASGVTGELHVEPAEGTA